jgi:hypothetical protein
MSDLCLELSPRLDTEEVFKPALEIVTGEMPAARSEAYTHFPSSAGLFEQIPHAENRSATFEVQECTAVRPGRPPSQLTFLLRQISQADSTFKRFLERTLDIWPTRLVGFISDGYQVDENADCCV